tara:strand:+ start:41 stop:631 length:591 start_codon:yes stop_codon:yes gene_type:complete
MAYHGHKLLEEHILKSKNLEGKTIIEVGSVREYLEGQNSTGFFMDLCMKHNMKLISVDMDPDCSANVHKEAEKRKFKNYEAITMKGEDYLKNIEIFDYLYLDGFDYHHDWHSDARKEKYKNILNTEITNEGSWRSHLDMVERVHKKGREHSLICIDDVFSPVKGKGCTAIPFLLQNGWSCLENNYNAAIFSNQSPP